MIGYVDCTLEESHDAGDHTVYVGHVETGEVVEGEADPLTFFRGDYGTMA